MNNLDYVGTPFPHNYIDGCDFVDNYTLQPQNEIQIQYYDLDQVIISTYHI